MKLSEQLKQDSDSGDFGRALEGYSERVKILEDALEWIGRVNAMDYEYVQVARKALSLYNT